MTKKYCIEINCYMKDYPHDHLSKNTITYKRDDLSNSCNVISSSTSIVDNKKYFDMAVGNNFFCCEVTDNASHFTNLEISDENLEYLISFLNDVKLKKVKSK